MIGRTHSIVLLTLVAACSRANDAQGAYRPFSTGDTLPVLAVRSLNAADSIRVGGTSDSLTLINLWATWCVPCVAEMPELDRLHKTHTALRMIGVSVDIGDDSAVARFVTQRKISFTIAHDPDGRVEQLFRTQGVPETFLVDRDGRILLHQVGPIPGGGGTLGHLLDSLADDLHK